MHCRPSTVYGLAGVRAWSFDNAVVRWGTAFEAAMQEATQNAKDAAQARRKQHSVLTRWLGPQPGMYRDPAKR